MTAQIDASYASRTIIAYCGFDNCERPMALHPFTVSGERFDFTVPCDREPDDFGKYEFDYLTVDGVITLFEDYSGNEANVERLITRDITDTDVDYTSPVGEWEALDAWRDKDPNVGTFASPVNHPVVISGQEPEAVTNARKAYFAASDDNISDTLRNAYVENNDGFIALKVLDEELTKKYHAHLLNWYLDKKTGKVRIGSIELSKLASNPDGTHAGIAATCVNRKCSYKDERGNYKQRCITADLALVDRDAMEEFVYAIIRHGNNHAANWFVTRDSFYELSMELGPKVTEDNASDFIAQHTARCNNVACQHSMAA